MSWTSRNYSKLTHTITEQSRNLIFRPKAFFFFFFKNGLALAHTGGKKRTQGAAQGAENHIDLITKECEKANGGEQCVKELVKKHIRCKRFVQSI